jgi:hypothetical protein
MLAFASTIPVNPPIVKRKINPNNQLIIAPFTRFFFFDPAILINQEKILIPVGTPIIIVAPVKYARVSTSNPTVYIW